MGGCVFLEVRVEYNAPAVWRSWPVGSPRRLRALMEGERSRSAGGRGLRTRFGCRVHGQRAGESEKAGGTAGLRPNRGRRAGAKSSTAHGRHWRWTAGARFFFIIYGGNGPAQGRRGKGKALGRKRAEFKNVLGRNYCQRYHGHQSRGGPRFRGCKAGPGHSGYRTINFDVKYASGGPFNQQGAGRMNLDLRNIASGDPIP